MLSTLAAFPGTMSTWHARPKEPTDDVSKTEVKTKKRIDSFEHRSWREDLIIIVYYIAVIVAVSDATKFSSLIVGSNKSWRHIYIHCTLWLLPMRRMCAGYRKAARPSEQSGPEKANPPSPPSPLTPLPTQHPTHPPTPPNPPPNPVAPVVVLFGTLT